MADIVDAARLLQPRSSANVSQRETDDDIQVDDLRVLDDTFDLLKEEEEEEDEEEEDLTVDEGPLFEEDGACFTALDVKSDDAAGPSECGFLTAAFLVLLVCAVLFLPSAPTNPPATETFSPAPADDVRGATSLLLIEGPLDKRSFLGQLVALTSPWPIG